jgi:hypothetical protein
MYSDGGFIIHNNMWNTSGYRVSETVEACSYDSWNVIATADNSSGDGAVKTYPNVHKDYHNWSTGNEPPLSNYPILSSSFAAAGPNTPASTTSRTTSGSTASGTAEAQTAK